MEKFKEYLELNNLSQRTIIEYTKEMERFFNYSNGEFNQDLINNFIITKKEELSIGGMNNYKKAFKHYSKFKEIVINIPKYGREITKQKQSLTHDEFKEIISSTQELFRDTWYRVDIVLNIMYYTGLRREEITLLKRKDIDLENNKIKVYHKKTKLEQYIVFPTKLSDKIRKYYEIDSLEIKNAFNTTTHDIDRWFSRLKKKFQSLNLHPHKFRFTFATNWNNKGGNIVHLKNQLGHSSIKTTENYIGVNVEKMQEESEKVFSNDN